MSAGIVSVFLARAVGQAAPPTVVQGPLVASAAAPAVPRLPPPLRAIVSGGPPPPILKLADVREGMVGYALTVFHGTKPEPFKIRVVSVLKRFLPKQDVILIRAEDPRVEFSGIVAGMSGSPVYIDGKLMGAIAYAWSFSKEPLGGVTPIETMLGERARPRRTKEELIAVAANERAKADTARELALNDGDGSPAGGAAWPARGVDLPPQAAGGPAGEPHLVRVAVPLSVSGFNPQSVAELTEEMRPLGLVPMQAGGGRALGKPAPGHLEPGSAIGVELVRGDMSMVGTGTVTYIDGSTVLAFGHPMFGIGEVYLPLVDAEIHSFLPSLSQSFKMSSPLQEIGVLMQDRQSCIIGDLNGRTTMLPVNVRVTGPGAEPRTFHAEVARNRRLTPMLVSTVVSNAIADSEPDVTDMVATVTSNVGIKGFAPLELRDQLFTTDGISGRALGASRGLKAVGELMFNPFEPVVLDRLDMDVRIEFRRDVADIIGLSLPNESVHAGDTVPLRVTLRPYAGVEYMETIPVTIPRALAGQAVRIEAASGVLVRPDMPPAETLRGYVDNLRKYYPATSIIVSVQSQEETVALRGRLMSALPAAALDTLRPGNQTRRGESYRVVDRTVFPSKRMVSGRQELSVVVREDALGRNRN